MIRAKEEGELGGDWYEGLFLGAFGLERSDFAGKRMLDVGCGPRGSLEWATEAAERVGLDPLAESYLALGASEHAMTYIAAGIEDAPLPDGSFDIVSSINSLDHVADIEAAARGLKRVLAPGGSLLLLTELGHEPTATEPQTFGWEVIDLFADELELVEHRRLENDGLFASALNGRSFDDSDPAKRPGVLVARLRAPA